MTKDERQEFLSHFEHDNQVTILTHADFEGVHHEYIKTEVVIPEVVIWTDFEGVHHERII